MDYQLPTYQERVTLSAGSYQRDDPADTLRVTLIEPVSFGDLNSDGVEDAAVLLAENGGGTGTFISLIVLLNHNGQPVQTAAVLIDDRPLITSLAINAGRVQVEATLHDFDDPACCPTWPVTETYNLNAAQNALTLMRLSALTSDGRQRSIDIHSPVSGSRVSGEVQVSGSMPIAPFENMLVYTLYDDQGQQLDRAGFPVGAEEMGGPAAFDQTIPLPALPTGSRIRLELSEESMADGSILSSDSVYLIIE